MDIHLYLHHGDSTGLEWNPGICIITSSIQRFWCAAKIENESEWFFPTQLWSYLTRPFMVKLCSTVCFSNVCVFLQSSHKTPSSLALIPPTPLPLFHFILPRSLHWNPLFQVKCPSYIPLYPSISLSSEHLLWFSVYLCGTPLGHKLQETIYLSNSVIPKHQAPSQTQSRCLIRELAVNNVEETDLRLIKW